MSLMTLGFFISSSTGGRDDLEHRRGINRSFTVEYKLCPLPVRLKAVIA